MVNVRRLVAIDIALHGAPLIIGEFVAAVAISAALGAFFLIRGKAIWQVWVAGYFFLLAINYVPMLIFALVIGSKRKASEEARVELQDRPALRRYGVRSLLLLAPLAIPLLALTQAFRTPRHQPES